MQVLDMQIEHTLLVKTAPAGFHRTLEGLLSSMHSDVSEELRDATEDLAAALVARRAHGIR